MKKIFIFLGKNTVPTIIISVIALGVFATSVYGFVKVKNLNTPIKDIPEVETVEQEEAINISPTPGLEIEEDNQENLAVSPTPSISPTAADRKNDSGRNKKHAQSTQIEVETKEGDDSEEDDDIENVKVDNDREHPESRN